MNRRLTSIHGWGRASSVLADEVVSEDLEAATAGATLTRGLGRSYGDASLPAQAGARVAGSRLADRLLDFDPTTGVLRAEAGLSLAQLNRVFLPRGWFSPVSPGTEFVTLGGMVAADVHGKNHHNSGSFGEHVRRLRMRLAGGDIVRCSDDEHADLFRATIGGFGLTGHILEVELGLERIPTPWIWQKVERAGDLDALLARLRERSAAWPYTVAWLDTFAQGSRFGRGVVISGRWAGAAEAPPRLPAPRRAVAFPLELPAWALNPAIGSAFNRLYYWRRGTAEGATHPAGFFYPLDVVLHWNRVYGRPGFTQYQCVVPPDEGGRSVRRVLERFRELRGVNYLAVIKDFGPEGRGVLSFPRPGTTISLDVPCRDWTQRLVDGLNALVIELGGRIYLAKDGLSRREDYRAMEPRLAAWSEIRRRWDPDRLLTSALDVRLLADAA